MQISWKMRASVAVACFLASACGPYGQQQAVPASVAKDAIAPTATVDMISAQDKARLNEVAAQACRCTRSTGAAAECWATFREETFRFGPASGFATACVPISTSLECFNGGDAAAGFCVMVGGTLLDRDRTELCSDEEVGIVGAIYTQTMKTTDDHERAMAAARTAARDLINGVKLEAPETEGGCTG